MTTPTTPPNTPTQLTLNDKTPNSKKPTKKTNESKKEKRKRPGYKMSTSMNMDCGAGGELSQKPKK